MLHGVDRGMRHGNCVNFDVAPSYASKAVSRATMAACGKLQPVGCGDQPYASGLS